MTEDETKAVIGAAKERFQDMRTERAPHEDAWRQIAELCLPRQGFTLTYGQTSLRPRTLRDTTASTATQRLAALIFGYMMPPYRPWVRPTVMGRDATAQEARWFGRRQQHMFDVLQSPQFGFTTAGYETLLGDVAFGNSVAWMGRNRPGAKPVVKSLPLMECFWQENADGVIDRHYRNFKMKLGAAARAWPTPKLTEKLKQQGAENQWVEFLEAVEPRDGGLPGLPAAQKPFRRALICLDTEEIAREDGYDTFPFIITRFNKRSGENYGEGTGLDSLPLARVLNAMTEDLLTAAELAIDPPLAAFVPLPKLDRRAGGVTNLTSSMLRRFDNPRDAIAKLYEGGNVTVSVEMVRDIRNQINYVNFIDWMALSAAPGATATEWNERRDIRLRSMTPIVARGESEKLTASAQRLYDITQDEFERPPASLGGEEISWEYFSPLAQAQQMSALEAFQRTMAVLQAASVFKPDVADIINLDAEVRDKAIAAGTARKNLVDPEIVAARRAERAQRQQAAEQLQLAQMGATAARDGAQAAASLAGAGLNGGQAA